MVGSGSPRRRAYPVAVWFLLLAVIFAAESAVMLLPALLPHPSSRLAEAALDAVLLTLVLAPVLWWTLVRPLQDALRLRTRFLGDLFGQIELGRRQTAGELHDGIGQALTLLISGLRSARACRETPVCALRVDGFQRLAENALTEVRRLALGLRPSLLDDLGLAPDLERLVEDTRAHSPCTLALDVADVIGVRLPDPVATAVFRIVQEALANVVKHSQARHTAVAVRRAGGNVRVEVSDDGRGIPPARLYAPPPGHLGLRGMRERATLLGATSPSNRPPAAGHA